ncbi:TetR family transcriptional regulator [Kribbella steppae]|uniref:TetR family transcriptional regulator n=1 Tax=Kribbella steppae TaxID=2512223 RepID=A0A4R2H547_9ACTN|nr:TetR/AcrR family transcriptional regulator [Kribbella steppae]TCO20546.1 TetR family transcriptional regulator [Kribbella steppae]
MTAVKRLSKRTEKAQETRRRITQAATDLFIEDGYGATNLQDIADRAGVAVQTIYFVFGNKRALLKELVDTTIAGDTEPVATLDRPWFTGAVAAATAEEMLTAYVPGSSAVLARVSPIMRVLEAAVANDPEVAALWPQDEDLRYVVQRAAANAFVTKPGARKDLTADEAADLLYGILSPELYLLFVRDRGWSHDRWVEWAGQTLRTQLCAAT